MSVKLGKFVTNNLAEVAAAWRFRSTDTIQTLPFPLLQPFQTPYRASLSLHRGFCNLFIFLVPELLFFLILAHSTPCI